MLDLKQILEPGLQQAEAGWNMGSFGAIAEGWVPCTGFYPESPVAGRRGEVKEFNRDAFDAFQTLLQTWDPEEYLAAKSACWTALEQGQEPATQSEPATRIGRAGMRNGLRQWRRLHGDSALLDSWSAAYDARTVLDEAENENPGHTPTA